MQTGSAALRSPKLTISFHAWPRTAQIAITLALVFLVGFVDLLTGEELSFFVFYFIPVSFAAWTLGKSWSISTAFLCTGAWLAVEKISGHTYSHPSLLIANLLIRWSSYTIMATLFFNLKRSRLELHSYANDLETRVARRTATLQERVAELEMIAYSVSHNLRAPLRAIDGMADALGEHLNDRPEPRDCLFRIRASARRMDQLVVGLVDFVQITLSQPALRPIPLGPILSEVADDLSRKFPAGKIDLAVPLDTPLVSANNRLVYRVAAELVNNALKFSDAAEPAVNIHCHQTSQGRIRVTIQDRGLGISPQHQQRIFGLFEQLHSYDRFGGIGMGLAAAKRCVEKMNGCIGVHSPGERAGSEFWFELPSAPRNESPRDVPQNQKPS